MRGVHGNTKIDAMTADRWLRRRGGVPKSGGVGYTTAVQFDASSVRTNAKDVTKAYLQNKHGKAGR